MFFILYAVSPRKNANNDDEIPPDISSKWLYYAFACLLYMLFLSAFLIIQSFNVWAFKKQSPNNKKVGSEYEQENKKTFPRMF